MSQKKPILRTVKLTVKLSDAAKALGHSDWLSLNEYLDADEHDDVHHGGYSGSDIKGIDLPGIFEGANLLFPREVAIALEDAERSAFASYLGTVRREAVCASLRKVKVSGEYQYEGEQISLPKGEEPEVLSCELDTPNALITVTIKNPEHLINDLVNGVGRYYPDIDPYVALPDDDVRRMFVASVGSYFDVYGDSKASASVDSRYSPSVKDDDFKEYLDFQIAENLSPEEIVESIATAVDNGRIESDKKALQMAAEMARREFDELVAALKEFRKSQVATASQRLDRLSEL